MGTQHAGGAAEPAVADTTVAPKGRKNPRAQVTLVARYRSPTAFEFVQEECFDLSAGGMFIKSPAPAPAGTLIKLECDINHGAQTIRGVARVVWLREQQSDGQPTGMGVKFVKLEAGGREALEAALKQLGTTASEPPDAGLRRSQPPARPGPASPRPSPPPLTRTPELPTSRAATPVTLSNPSAVPTTKPPPLPPALPTREASAAKVEQAQPRSAVPQAATKTASRAVQSPKAADADAHSGMRTLIYSVALALAALAVYVTRDNPKPAVQTAKLPSAVQLEPAKETRPAEATASAPTPAVPPAAVVAAVVEDKPVPEPTYVLDVATIPDGARVTLGERSVVTPATLELGTLSEPVQLSAEKEGFQRTSAVVDRVGFMLDEGQMRRRISLTLVAEPQPAKVEPVPARSKPARSAEKAPKAKPAPAKLAAASESDARPAAPTPTIMPVEPQPETKVEPPATTAVADKPANADRSAPTPAKATTKVAPMEAATACLATGDNACVVKALEGKAKSARELELLIETYRALGDTAKAEKQMQVYVDKYPTERHAGGFRRVLERRQSEAAGAP